MSKGLFQVAVTENSVLKAFHKKNDSSNKTSEEEALHLLSQLPNPAAVRDEDTSKPVYNLTLLHHACYNGWYGVAKVLIEKYGCDPDCKSSIDSTPLHCAYRSGKVEIIEYLISNMGCDPLQVTSNGLTRLHYASAGGHLQIVKYLIEKEKCDPKCNKDQTPLHLACESVELDVAKYLIEEQDCDPGCKMSNGWTPLHSACLYGHLEIAKYLLEEQHCGQGCKTGNGWTPLHLACQNGHLEIAKYLIEEQHCDPGCKMSDGCTPLHSACLHGHLEIAKYLIEEQHSDPGCKTSDGWTPLHLACQNGHLKIAKYIIEEQHCYPGSKISNGWTPLHSVCKNGHLEIAKYLIEEQHCDPGCKKSNSRTPLHLACKNGHLEITKYLIEEQHCDPGCKTSFGSMPLHLACLNGHLEIAKYLVEEQHCDPGCKKSNGCTPLHSACLYGHLEIAKYLIEERNCDPGCKKSFGSTPLHLACQNGHLEIAKYLIEEQNYDPGCKTSDCWTSLHLACLNGHLEIAKYLIEEQYCDPGCKMSDGWTPLHLVCQNGHLKIAKYLIEEQHCDPCCKTIDGWTPLHLACQDGHLEIAKYLIEEQHCIPGCKMSDGWTPLHSVCQVGHLETAKYLIEKQHCDPGCKKSDGGTPLHLACQNGQLEIAKYLIEVCSTKLTVAPFYLAVRHGHLELVLYLVNECIEDISFLPSSNICLDEAIKSGNDDIVLFLLSCGLKISSNASQAGSPFSNLVQPALKVCVLGNSESGKSTLVKALMSNLVEGGWFNSIFNPRVTGVEPHTAGIIPYHAHSPKCGRFILYDFAGQYEHYSSSHAAILENLKCADGDLVFIVIDICKNKEQIVQELQYWDSFVSNQYGQELKKPTVIVIGSHLDVAKSQGKHTFCQALCEFPHLNISVTLDCTRKSSPGLTEVGTHISTHSKQRQTQFSVSAQAHFLNRLIHIEFKDKVACQLHEISTAIAHESNDELMRNSLLPSEIDSLSKQLSKLSEHGHILYFKDSKDLSHSWIVLKKEMLLSELNGSIFAPKEFESVYKDLSSTGVVALSEVKQNFPQYDHEMLMSFMKLLDFCHQIDELEVSLISGEIPQTEQSEFTVTNEVHINESEKIKEVYYFFPALVSTERPTSNCQTILDKCYKFGWCLLCKRNMFTSRFLHVLLLRLAFTYALPNTSPPSEDTTLRVERRQCNVWKNGIHWLNMDGVEIIVEVVEQNTAVILLMGCLERSQLKCIHLRSAIIECILSTQRKYSNAVDTEECFLHPTELRKYDLNKVNDIYNFPLNILSNAIVKRKDTLTNKIGQRQEMITIDELLYFEPYTCLSIELISKLIQKSETDEEVSDDFLRDCARVAHPNLALLKKMFLSPEQDSEYNTALMSPRDQYSDDPTHKCFLIFITWKKFKENPSHKEFRKVFDSYSVFSGRSPLISEL